MNKKAYAVCEEVHEVSIPDLNQCQAEVPNTGNIRSITGNHGGMKRCSSKPGFVVSTNKGVNDSERSMCAECFLLFIGHFHTGITKTYNARVM